MFEDILEINNILNLKFIVFDNMIIYEKSITNIYALHRNRIKYNCFYDSVHPLTRLSLNNANIARTRVQD